VVVVIFTTVLRNWEVMGCFRSPLPSARAQINYYLFHDSCYNNLHEIQDSLWLGGEVGIMIL
jgi:hypothetical protein